MRLLKLIVELALFEASSTWRLAVYRAANRQSERRLQKQLSQIKETLRRC